jgi:glycosyltransferase involved in cell wall biosynthesis
MKLACVIHRFGPRMTGGSEAHCRAIATHLAAQGHDVEILTSCATDYVTWANALPAGESRDGALKIRRFPVTRPRHLNRFREISEVVFTGHATEEDQRRWFRENGPEMPLLLDHLRTHGRHYDRVLFWSFRYYPTFYGLPLVKDRAILVPTAEDDDVIRTANILGEYFATPRAYLFLTPEEKTLVEARCTGPLPPSEVIGAGLEPAPSPKEAASPDAPYALYLGRVEKNKGCDRLIDYFLSYAEGGQPAIELVMAGPSIMEIPAHPAIRVLGFVEEGRRDALLAGARVLIMPSPYESLSMVLLEAWRAGTPALVFGRCKPLRGQTERANGGLFYAQREEFIEALGLFVRHPAEARQFGLQGRDYVLREYRWAVVLDKISRILGV